MDRTASASGAGSGSELARTTLAFLRRKIVSGEWPVNSRIPYETDLMEMLGVGKSTVREAVRSLASLGMLEAVRGVGTFVRSRTPVSGVLTQLLDDYAISDILVYRRALEIEAAQRAAAGRTEQQLRALQDSYDDDGDGEPDGRSVERGHTPGQFHFLVFEASGSPLLLSLYGGVMAAIRHHQDAGRLVHAADQELRRHDHGALLEAIRDRDVARAAQVAARHVDRDLVSRDAVPAPPGSAPSEGSARTGR